MAFSNRIPDEDREQLYAAGKEAEASLDQDICQFLEERRRSAIADLHAHQAAHKGRFAHTMPCYMDSRGTCHGDGEQIVENADRAIEAYDAALSEMITGAEGPGQKRG